MLKLKPTVSCTVHSGDHSLSTSEETSPPKLSCVLQEFFINLKFPFNLLNCKQTWVCKCYLTIPAPIFSAPFCLLNQHQNQIPAEAHLMHLSLITMNNLQPRTSRIHFDIHFLFVKKVCSSVVSRNWVWLYTICAWKNNITCFSHPCFFLHSYRPRKNYLSQ